MVVDGGRPPARLHLLSSVMRTFLRRLGVAADVLLLATVVASGALATRDFSRYVDHYPYLATDDGLANVSYSLATAGRYGFLSSPTQGFTTVSRHDGFFNYGPWYFYAGAGLIWLFGYSLALLRGMHLMGILLIGATACWWFGKRGQTAAGAIVALALIHAFEVAQWPMVRPDIAVSIFAVVFIVAAGRAVETRSPLWWLIAGLASGCAAFTHLIAWALVPCCVITFALAVAADRPKSALRGAMMLAAVAVGGAAAAFMFYGSFGFRIRDHWSSVAGYGQFLSVSTSGADGTYRAVLARHLSIAFGYLTPWSRRLLMALTASALGLLLASWRRPAMRRVTIAWLLPPIAVFACYALSLSTYPNFHNGYAILTEVAAWWCAASAIAVALTLLAERTPRFAAVARAVVTIVVLALAAAQIEANPKTARYRLEWVKDWASIHDYTNQIDELLPNGASAWGSLVFGIENPGRIQLVQTADALGVVERARLTHAVDPPTIAPEYIVWGYPENLNNTLAVVGRSTVAANVLDRLPDSFPGAEYHLIALIVARPYGVTRIYSRAFTRPNAPAPLPAVSAYDPSADGWARSLDGPLARPFDPAPPVALAIGSPPPESPIAADRSVVGDVPKGRWLLRVHVGRSVGPAHRRTLVVTSAASVRDTLSELGSTLDFAPYTKTDEDVYLVHDHQGGPLYVSQFDDGSGASIAGVNAYRIVPQVRADMVATHVAFRDLPGFAQWVPSDGVRMTLDASGLVVDGDSSAGGYQIRSPRVTLAPHDRAHVRAEIASERGRVCLGVLNGKEEVFLKSSSEPGGDLEFTADAGGAFVLVVMNCNRSGAAVPSRFVLSRAAYATELSGLYVDRLMAQLAPEAPAGAPSRRVYSVPSGLSPTPDDLARVKKTLLTRDFRFNASIARSALDGWMVRGKAEGPYAYVLVSKPQTVTDSRRLLVVGRLLRGGLSVGLLKDGKWAGQVNVEDSGLFTAVIQPPGPGEYEIVVANNLAGASRDNDFSLSQISWIGR